ncbi:MAG: 2-oxo acid dehydrogenase subunit E2 [Elusimicrobia bacterium]|nr:2-oxo acid dehydrogenase subunit E2 [Elusimicrobiota bacterium]
MNFEFKLPDIGEGLVEGEIVRWFVKEGDAIRENEPLAAVLTDKAEVEIPSPKTGKVLKLYGKPGEKIKVHAPLALFETGGGDASAPAKAAAAAPAPSRAAEAAPKTAAPAVVKPAARPTDVLATPRVRKLAKDAGVDLARLRGSGPQGRVLEADVRGFKGGAPAAAAAADARATPAVKALAAELGADLSRVRGTGPGGRVVEADVRAAALAGARAPTQAAAPAAALASEPGDERRPFVGIRRKIAERMIRSQNAVAHVTHMDECDMTAVLALREELKPEAAKRGVKLTFLPFVIKALTRTLQDFPLLNSSIDDAAGEIVVKRRCNIGIAVAAPQGLVVPNVKDAGAKDLWGLAAEVAALAEAVRANKIAVTALQGGSFTITNIGPIGGLFATPIVNHPEVAILGLMKLQKRPVWRENEIRVRDMMNLALSFDHRIVDGAEAAQFTNALIQRLENPRTLL